MSIEGVQAACARLAGAFRAGARFQAPIADRSVGFRLMRAHLCVVKRLWRFSKVRYRGLAKNATRTFTPLALGNIYLDRRPLLQPIPGPDKTGL